MAKRNQDPLGLGKLQRRMEGGGRDRGKSARYTVEVKEEPRGLLSGFRGVLVLFAGVVVVMVLVTIGGR